MTVGYGPATPAVFRLASDSLQKRNSYHHVQALPVAPQAAAMPLPVMGDALICKDLNEWADPKCNSFRALLIQRPRDGCYLQQAVDNIAEYLDAKEEVALPQSMADQWWFGEELSNKARRITASALRLGLPAQVGQQLEQDFAQIGTVLQRMVPDAKQMWLKLEIMGTNACSRWHRDRYIGRAIVSYNSQGTQFVATSNVNENHLECGGQCQDIIRDETKVFQSEIGDILFMKGSKYPASPNGLVHRSPPIKYQDNGAVFNRLLLKVDLL